MLPSLTLVGNLATLHASPHCPVNCPGSGADYHRFFAMPIVLHFNADKPYHIKDREEFDAIFSAWKRSPNSNFHSTRIDSIRVNNVLFNYFCVADVTYSRLDNKGNTINQQRILYNLIKGDKFGPLGLLIKWFKKWKIYMITNVEMVE